MSKNKQLTLEQIDAASQNLSLEDRITLWRNWKVIIDDEMEKLRSEISEKETIVDNWMAINGEKK